MLVDAESFYARMLRSIAMARHTVDLECYIFNIDSVGEQFIAAFGDAAKRGVRVRVLIDGIGSLYSSQIIALRLFKLGVAVQIYHPLPWLAGSYRWSRTHGGWANRFMLLLLNLNRRNHRKLCVVDNDAAWVGSFNISAVHLSKALGGKGWRDYAVELHGRGVDSLEAGFSRLWTLQKARFHHGFFGRYLSNVSLRARQLKNRFVRRSVAGASTRVWLVSAYFAPTASFRRSLLAACRQQVDVRLLLPGESDVAIFPALSSHYYRQLLRAGARIFIYQGGILHAKALLIDDLAIVGSSNWNHRSTLHDLELDVVLRTGEIVQEIEGVINADLATSRELLISDTDNPSLLSWLWYALRYWM